MSTGSSETPVVNPRGTTHRYGWTASSVLLVAIFHASSDGAINQLSYDIVPASNKVRFLIFSVVIMLAATTLIIATKGQARPSQGSR